MDATYLSNLIFLINAVSESIIRLLYTGQWIENEEKTEVKFVCNKKDVKPFSSHREIVPFLLPLFCNSTKSDPQMLKLFNK